jgi:hypothetical protein
MTRVVAYQLSLGSNLSRMGQGFESPRGLFSELVRFLLPKTFLNPKDGDGSDQEIQDAGFQFCAPSYYLF